MEQEKKKRIIKKCKKALIITLIVIAALAVVAGATYFILRLVGKSHFKPAVMSAEDVNTIEGASATDGSSIKYNGKVYKPNKDVIYFAFIGVDKETLGTEEGREHSAGQSDVNMIFAFDTKNGDISFILIPRDTMVDIDILNSSGDRIGISEEQLCLSYAYGDGRERSCENVLVSMERLLFGIEIDNYYALDLDGIGVLNDAVGGIELTALEDIHGSYFYCSKGDRLYLWGNDANIYVRYRDTSVRESDTTRRQRQIQYAKAFAFKAFEQIKKDSSKVSEIYNAAQDYSCTNFDLSRVTYLASVLVDKRARLTIDNDDIHILEGEDLGTGDFREIHLDRTKVFETILDVFYVEE
ncbi:MAG: LCP family protein [Clostridia bacterium]|nr:LCP family protein [Clostridia bacterium]